MASRTGGSTGILAFLVITSLAAFGMFVATIFLVARVQKLSNDLALKQADLDAAVRADERDDRWEQLKSLARGTGVVRYLDRNLQEIAASVSGSRRDDPDTLLAKIKGASGAEGTPLLPLLSARDGEIAGLRNQVRSAENARAAAQSDLLASVERVRALEEEHRRTIARLNAEIDVYKAGTYQYRDGVESAKADFSSRIGTLRTDSEAAIAGLEGRIRDLEQQLLIANDQLRRLKQDQSALSLRPAAEEALVDARIVGVNTAARQVYIDIGRRERAVLGMTFEVYASAGAIAPNEAGVYPQGKATIEIIRIDETSSVARIIRETPGAPILVGDVIANAVYDPNKVYTFVVFGNFDTDGDGIATAQEAQDIKGLIESWNGRLSDDISGDTDFLVLGEKPVLPPQPRPTDPVELIQRYLMLRQTVARYDDLFERARQAGIPVLNQNRLYTLTGLYARR